MVLLAHHLLMEFNHVFLLEPNKMGLSDATEQVIEIKIDEVVAGCPLLLEEYERDARQYDHDSHCCALLTSLPV